MKTSGLADSPFFTPSPSNREVEPPSISHAIEPLYEHSGEQAHERTDEHLNIRTSEQTNTRTGEQVNTRAPEHLNSRTNEQANRSISRQSYNIYDDQAEAIELLAMRWRKERGKHITKSELVRELLEAAIKQENERLNK